MAQARYRQSAKHHHYCECGKHEVCYDGYCSKKEDVQCKDCADEDYDDSFTAKHPELSEAPSFLYIVWQNIKRIANCE